MQKMWFNPWDRKTAWRREWLPTSVFLHGEFHGQRSLAAEYSPWGSKESDTTEQLTHTDTHTHIKNTRRHDSILVFIFINSKREWAQALKIALHQKLLKASIYVDNFLNKKLNLLDVMTVRKKKFSFTTCSPLHAFCLYFIEYYYVQIFFLIHVALQ